MGSKGKAVYGMSEIIGHAESFIRGLFENEFSGHDFFHSMRVCRTAVRIAETEGADAEETALIALLHDADDIKLSPATHENMDRARAFLEKEGVSEKRIRRILTAISEISFRGTDSIAPSAAEGKCVQDADRLDALGAIGIARTFAYGGSRGRAMYDPDEKPLENMTEAEYRASRSASVNHFYEKLFHLKDLMNTEYGRKLAEKREAFMKEYLSHFYAEWEGNDEED